MTAHRGGTSWPLAARLARREVRRRPGRTLLVMLLVALPIFAMTVGGVLFRTGDDSHTEKFHRQNGRADLASQSFLIGERTVAGLVDEMPAGTRALAVREARVPVTPADPELSRRYVELTDLAMQDPIARGIVQVEDGRAPHAGEVLLSREVAEQLGVDVGSTLRLAQPNLTAKVAGIGRLANDFDAPVLVAPGFDFSVVRSGYASERALIDLPAGAAPSAVAATVNGRGATFEAADRDLDAPSDGSATLRPLAWGWVVGALLLAIMGVIISAAFATSARRQLVTLGQLSANGADQRLLRRALSLQGSWSGLLGASVGVVAAILSLIGFRSTVEQIIRHDPGSYVFVASDLVIILLTGIGAATIAAFVPARTITKVPVLTALGGRRPIGTVPRRLVPTGLALFGGGVALLALVAAGSRGKTGSGDLFAVAAVIGGLAVLGGVCCISPVVVGALGPVAARLGGPARLAARSLARVRTRSAAVVTAIAVAGAVAVGFATFLSMDDRGGTSAPFIAENAVIVAGSGAGESVHAVPTDAAPAATLAAVKRIVPDIRFTPLRRVAIQPERQPGDPLFEQPGTVTIADPPVLNMIRLSGRDAAALARIGALEMVESPVERVSANVIRVQRAGGQPFLAAVRQDEPASFGGEIGILVTPPRAAELGIAASNPPTLGIAPAALTEDQKARLLELSDDPFASAFADAKQPVTNVGLVSFDSATRRVSESTVQLWIVGGTLAFTLLVVAIGLALSAAESREERDVLVAVGARPRTLGRVAGLKAVFLAVAGALLAVPAGFIPVTLVVRSAASELAPVKPVVFPWLTAVLLLLAVPVIAGFVSWLGSSIAQRARPVQMSTLAVD